MLKISKADKITVAQLIRKGKISAAALSASNIIDDIIIAMSKRGILDCLINGFKDKRASNSQKPYKIILALIIAAKMRVNTSLTDIPFALKDHRTISELGFSLYDTKRDIKKGFMSEGTIRSLIDKSEAQEFIESYNTTVQNEIIPKMNFEPTIFILDCTDIEKNPDNLNYEGAGFCYRKKKRKYGYKLATLRALIGDTGIIVEIRFGSIAPHDVNFCREMLMTTTVFKPGDILIVDSGFIDRTLTDFLKNERGVDVCIPVRSDMDAHEDAVKIACKENKWSTHPNKKMAHQLIASVPNLGASWAKRPIKNNVDFNTCVVYDTKKDFYQVFISTDTTQTARDIIKTYGTRWEVEEDYRQLKDFWQIEDFTCTSLHTITFHIVFTLLGYLFFQLYTMLPEGEEWARKSLPVVLKNYIPQAHPYVVVYADDKFGIFALYEILELYEECDKTSKLILLEVIKEI